MGPRHVKPLLLLALSACASSPDTAADTAPCPHERVVTWAEGGEAFFLSYCRSCHSETASDRHGAPEYLNYDTLESVRAAAHNIRQAALWDQVMPPGYPLGEAERETLASFLDCGL